MVNKLQVKQRDQNWALQIRNGDETAFSLLYKTYYVDLCNYANSKVGDSARAQDFVQDVFTWVWNSREKWHPNESVKAYLVRAVDNRIITCYRKKHFNLLFGNKLYNYNELLLAHFDEKDNLNHEIEVIRRLIKKLPEKRRKVVLLFLDHGMTYKEISAELGISVNTIDVQLRRARKFLSENFCKYFNIEKMDTASIKN